MPKPRKIYVSGLKLGDKVKMVNCLEAESYPDKIWTTRSEPWIMSGHTEMIMLEGFRGGFCTEMLERVD